MIRLCLAGAFYFSPPAVGPDTALAESSCPRTQPTPLAALPNTEPVGRGEQLAYESRVEARQGGTTTYAYIYCVANGRKNRSLKVAWFHDQNTVYFGGTIAPGDERGSMRTTLNPNFVEAPRILQFEDQERRPGTLVPLSELTKISDKELVLASDATFEIAADPETEFLISRGKQGDYKSDDFLKVSVTFNSTLKRVSSEATEITNDLNVKFLSEPNRADKVLSSWPKFFRAGPEGKQFILKQGESAIGVPLRPRDNQVSRVVIRSSGPIEERQGVIEITDGKNSYGAFPISYFKPN